MDKAYYTAYYRLEREHWWFRARLHILEQFAKRHLTQTGVTPAILNVGVATGATSLMLQQFGKVTSVEFDHDCCVFLREAVNLEVTQASLTALPFADASFDWVCAYDVIEHIEEDAAALREIWRVLKPGGKFHLTVPAFQALWSSHDDINHHFRRYKARQLRERLTAAGLQIDYLTYFNCFLFFPVATVRLMANFWQRLRGKKQEKAAASDFETYNTSGLTGKLLYRIFRAETPLLLRKIRLPVGISLLVTGQKPA